MDDNFAHLPPPRGRVKSWIFLGHAKPRHKGVITNNKIHPVRQPNLDLEPQTGGDIKSGNVKSVIYTAKDSCIVISWFSSNAKRDIRQQKHGCKMLDLCTFMTAFYGL